MPRDTNHDDEHLCDQMLPCAFYAHGSFSSPEVHYTGRRVGATGDTLARAGVTVEVSEDIFKVRWTKFLWVAPIGGLGAVTRSTVGEILSYPEKKRLFERAMQEVEALALARGIVLDPDIVRETMAFAESLEPDLTASMQRDISDGRPSELEA